MFTVTVAATYGAGGSVIAPAVAKRLGLPFIDRVIPVAVAEEIHEPLEAALCDDVDHAPRVAPERPSRTANPGRSLSRADGAMKPMSVSAAPRTRRRTGSSRPGCDTAASGPIF
jgi:hypothetical protein